MLSLKKLALLGQRIPGATAPLHWLIRHRATIFMLHRFSQPDQGIPGHDADELRETLAYLRREGYEFVSLRDVFLRLREGNPSLRRAVSFTIDDGYADQVEIAAPVFAEFDCPVTTFVCTGFLDGRLWMWWDRIEYVFRETGHRELSLESSLGALHFKWADEAGRNLAQREFTEICKKMTDGDKHAAILEIAARAEVELPATPPSQYAPVTWDALRAAEQRGMRFAPHTMTHPVLTRTSDEQARQEIGDSMKRVQAECADPDPFFCYPNGQHGDFGPREFQILEELGFSGAVAGYAGYASAHAWSDDPLARFAVRRFSYPNHRPDVIQYASGLERLKSILRREAAN
jgi:peptidoglycan/xylan/chitin deacetylase (PgdA/CDA1 family)